MFDDIIRKKQKGFIWDFDQYEKSPYCPVCGSKDLTYIRESLTSKKLEKDVRCNFCNAEWHEEWNKDIELELREVSICTG